MRKKSVPGSTKIGREPKDDSKQSAGEFSNPDGV